MIEDLWVSGNREEEIVSDPRVRISRKKQSCLLIYQLLSAMLKIPVSDDESKVCG